MSNNLNCHPETDYYWIQLLFSSLLFALGRFIGFIETYSDVFDFILKLAQIFAYFGTGIVGLIALFKFYKEQLGKTKLKKK